MDIHKPKPIHNWGEFLKELGTIALGVGVALAAEQGVEWWHWHSKVTEAREVIASEMARNISYAIIRARAWTCETQRLTDLSNILDGAARQGSLPPLGYAGGALQIPWSTGAWDGVVASQAATHFSRTQLAELSLAYRRVERIENWNREESEAWTFIHAMEGPGRRLDPPFETELRKAINRADYLNGVINISATRMVRQVMDQNLPFNAEDRKKMAEAMKYQPSLYICGKFASRPPPKFSKSQMAELNELQERLTAFVAPPKP